MRRKNTMNTMPAIMLRCSADHRKSAQARQDDGEFFMLRFRCTRSTKRERTTMIRPIKNRDHSPIRETDRARATELAYRVTQRLQAKDQGNRHEEQAPTRFRSFI